jgi:hypothetical protein
VPSTFAEQGPTGLKELQEDLQRQVHGLYGQLEAAIRGTGLPDPEFSERFAKTLNQLSVRLSNDLPPQLDPGAAAEIRRILVNVLGELNEVDVERPLDAIDSFFVGAEAVRHIIRDALDEQVGRVDEDARELVEYLRVALPRISQADQATLLGISARHLQRLAKGGGTSPRRTALVAQLVQILRYTWTPEGVVAWFYRRRRALDDHAPVDVLDEVGFEQALLQLARQVRAEHGS